MSKSRPHYVIEYSFPGAVSHTQALRASDDQAAIEASKIETIGIRSRFGADWISYRVSKGSGKTAEVIYNSLEPPHA